MERSIEPLAPNFSWSARRSVDVIRVKLRSLRDIDYQPDMWYTLWVHEDSTHQG